MSYAIAIYIINNYVYLYRYTYETKDVDPMLPKN